MASIAIYLHWPFCIKKCPYCDFISYPYLYDKSYEDLLYQDLVISAQKINFDTVNSIFFGGGTPSLLSPQCIEKIIRLLSTRFSIRPEITLEANPHTFNDQKMLDFKNAGINRISLGIQSFDEGNLKFLGRIYGSKEAKHALQIVEKHFNNFSCDFMYGFETQSLQKIRNDLKMAIDFRVKHVSAYQLTFESGTPFFSKLMYGNIKSTTEDETIEYLDFIEKYLLQNGMKRYEISNYAIPGFESRHNLAYWNYTDYLGVGPSAHSRVTINGQKHAISKSQNLYQWSSHIGEWERDDVLSNGELIEEFIIVGLRKIHGIPYHDFLSKINYDPIIMQRTNHLITQKLLKQTENTIRLTTEGLLKLNSVIEYLLS